MRTFVVLISIICLLLASCEPIYDLVQPEFSSESFLKNTDSISYKIKQRIEGVYRVVKGSGHFGDIVIARWSGETLSLFGRNHGAYFILKSGSKDTLLLFEGKWRYAVSTETGLVRFAINKRTGLDSLLNDTSGTKSFSFVGTFGSDNDWQTDEIQLSYIRPFSETVRNKDYYILAHRGGGRNSDFVGASENSLEIISLAEQLGANGIEIDVMLSKDNIPFLYHDSNINLRETKKGLLLGPVENYTIAQLKSFVELKNGEKIPTLREALEHVLYKTNLKFVWLDMKSERNSMPQVIEIQKDILERASMIGRSLEILVGLPTDFMLNNLLAYPNYQNVPSLCELSIDQFHSVGSKVWAPRWTMGTLIPDVRALHGEGKRAFVWTLDQTLFIQQFINESEFDGILTNYPTIVASFYYAKE
ncbi:MAG: glycerophosphodiester phosphodiesterase [Ignavibacteriaceae bacterium]|nr:glycerophosphodiester phosphodiesterase [Ignavibacteriaceae bacterium]